MQVIVIFIMAKLSEHFVPARIPLNLQKYIAEKIKILTFQRLKSVLLGLGNKLTLSCCDL